ncbi:MAG: 30S ribosomal protein S6 [Spirochaetales bacterium]|nr:30S ribosomal protein S6 [Spirochaetales bacterium]
MRNYEVVFIFRTEVDAYKSGLDKVKEELQKAGATIVKEDDLGDRELAYPIKKESRGHYHFFDLELKPDQIVQIEKNIKLISEVLKFLFVKKEQ